MLEASQRERYAVGDLVVDTEQGIVTRQGEPLPLPPRTFELLLALVRRSPNRVRRHELLETVWPEEIVSDQTLSHRVLLLRRALGDDSAHPRYLASDRGWGYHLVVPVTRLADARETSQAARKPPPALVAAGVPVLAAAGLALLLPGPSRDRLEARVTPAVLAVGEIEAPSGDRAEAFVARRLGTRLAFVAAAEPWLAVIRGDAPGGSQPSARIEGSVQPVGDGTSALALRLIEPASGRVLWSRTATGSVYELFDAEDRVTQEAITALRRVLDLPAPAPEALALRLEVSELCLRGEWLLRSWQGPSLRQAARMYERALALDATSASAHAGLSITRTTLALLGEQPAAEAAAPAQSEAHEALRLGSTLAAAHAALGLVRLVFDWDLAGARTELRRALDAGPREVIPLVAHAFYLQAVGEPDASLLLLQRAAEQDPYAAPIPYLVGRAHYLAGRPEAALEAYARALELDPYLAQAHLAAAHCHSALGRGTAALASLLQERRLSGTSAARLGALERALAEGGLRRLWGRVCHDPAAREATAVPTAAACARAGLTDEAVGWLQRAVVKRVPGVISVGVDPAFAALRDRVELAQLLTQNGLPCSRPTLAWPGDDRPKPTDAGR